MPHDGTRSKNKKLAAANIQGWTKDGKGHPKCTRARHHNISTAGQCALTSVGALTHPGLSSVAGSTPSS